METKAERVLHLVRRGREREGGRDGGREEEEGREEREM